MTIQKMADGITEMRWRMKNETQAVWDLLFFGQPVTIADPYPEVLDDNPESRVWIAKHYGYLLAVFAPVE
jgi:hypothetical protein